MLTTHLSSASRSLTTSGIQANTAAHAILLAVLASQSLDEISDIDDGDGIRRYITSLGKPLPHSNVTRMGLLFWLYPTGHVGPSERLEEDSERGKKGDVLYHGVLVTMEPGVIIEDAVREIKAALPVDGLSTLHITQPEGLLSELE